MRAHPRGKRPRRGGRADGCQWGAGCSLAQPCRRELLDSSRVPCVNFITSRLGDVDPRPSIMIGRSMAITASSTSNGHLSRDVGFWGLMFVSLGSIIGSGWLLGALTAATLAGPASLISWVLAAIMLALLALVHAELGAAYPAAGGTARFPR